jgi:predicted nucleic-acid-binding Zn-ribbon protein
MKNGRCPMCGSNEIYENSEVSFSVNGNDVSLSDDMGREALVFSFVPYVCMNCGFTSMYVGDMDDIKNLPRTKGWIKVP